MILTSIAAPVPFTPTWYLQEDGSAKPGAKTFLLRAGSVSERGLYEAELAGDYRGGRVYGFELRAAIRDGVALLLADDPERERVLELVNADADETGDIVLAPEEQLLLTEVRKVLAEHYPPYRDLVAQLERRRELGPVLAFRRFCVGAEGLEVPFKRGPDGMVSEATLKAIDAFDLIAAGTRVQNMLYATEQEGNSVRPSPSDAAPKTSPSAATSTAAGSSASKPGRKTPG